MYGKQKKQRTKLKQKENSLMYRERQKNIPKTVEPIIQATMYEENIKPKGGTAQSSSKAPNFIAGTHSNTNVYIAPNNYNSDDKKLKRIIKFKKKQIRRREKKGRERK